MTSTACRCALRVSPQDDYNHCSGSTSNRPIPEQAPGGTVAGQIYGPQARKVVAIQLINRLKAQMAEEGRLSVQLVDEEHESEKSYSVLTYEGRVQFDAEPSRDVPIRLQMIVSPEAIYLIVSQGPNAVLQLGPAKFYTSSV